MCHGLDGLEVCALGIQPCRRTIMFVNSSDIWPSWLPFSAGRERIVADLATAHLAGDSPCASYSFLRISSPVTVVIRSR
jgi:hypothetical protein